MKEIYAVMDIKAGSFGTPMFFVSRGVAVRGFVDAACKGEGPIGEHPSDYQLFELGKFDEASGKFTVLDKPEFIINGVSAVASGEEEKKKYMPELPFVEKKEELTDADSDE